METRIREDENGNIRLMEANIKARLIQAKDGTLSIRIFLTKEQKEDFCLQIGKQPNTIFNSISIL